MSATAPSAAAPAAPAAPVCPSCGAFAGALPRCPRCGARQQGRTSLRAFRVASVLLATAGLGLLFLMARYREIPRVRLADVGRSMNFAYVRIAGTAAGDARVYRRAGAVDGLRFVVDDGTGRVTVRAPARCASALVASNLVPRAGDRVEVTGSLNVTAEDVGLFLQSPAQLALAPGEPPAVPLASIHAGAEGQACVVSGLVARVRTPRPGTRAPYVLALADGGAQRNLVFFEDVFAGFPGGALPAVGTRVRARVAVGVYRDEVQLSLARAGDLEALPPEAAPAPDAPPAAPAAVPPTPLGSLGAEREGARVRVAGEVVAVRAPPEGSRAPWLVTLRDASGSAPLVYWADVAAALPPGLVATGRWVEAAGTVGTHRGALQVKVAAAAAVRSAGPGGGAAP